MPDPTDQTTRRPTLPGTGTLPDALSGLIAISDQLGEVISVIEVPPDDGEYRFLHANRAFLQGSRRLAELVIGQPPHVAFPAEAEEMVERWRRAAAAGRPVQVASTVGDKFIRTTFSPLLDDTGRCTHLVATTHDETEARADSDRLRAVFASRSEGRALLGADLAITEVLLGERTVWGGREPSSLVGLNLTELLEPDDDHLIEELRIGHGSAPGATTHAEARIRSVDGESRWAEVTLTNLLHEPSVGWIALAVRDCHDRRTAQIHLEEAERQLLQAQKLEAVGQLAAGIAHEINTPMQYIGDNVHFLKAAVERLLKVADRAGRAAAESATQADRTELGAALHNARLPVIAQRAPKAADDALAGVENVSRIVAAMKRFSHPGDGAMTPLDLNDSLATTITVCRNEWKYTAVVETDFEDNLPLVDGYLGPLNQVWLNMIVNANHAIAERHGDQRGTIRISTRTTEDGEGVRVVFADNGTGIAEGQRHRVFEPFFTTKEVGRGTGQGLAIAHQVIVEEHGGSIELDTEVGRGTTFTVTLPRRQACTDRSGP